MTIILIIYERNKEKERRKKGEKKGDETFRKPHGLSGGHLGCKYRYTVKL